MKFFCEYCGCRIDAEVDDKCPNCGASYKKNATFIRLEEEKNERLNKINDIQDKVFSHVNNTFKLSKVFIVIPIIVFIVIFAIIIFGFVKAQKSYDNSNYSKQETIIEETVNNNEEKTKLENVVVNGLNTYGETSDYRVRVTGYEDVTFWYKEAQSGYKFVKFYLEVENLTEKEISRMDVNCVVNGVAQTNDFSSGYSTSPYRISTGLTVKGDATFEVPIDASGYDIRYGDYITIHIEK